MRLGYSTYSAITILNAIKSTHGAAFGVNILNNASIKDHDKLEIRTNPKTSTYLIESCIETVKQLKNIEIDNILIQTDSPLPPERGLKTSSAISTALIKLLSDYYQLELSTNKIIEISAKASIKANVSITGAYDDAYASFCGGLAFTKNNGQLIHMRESNITDNILILIPNNKNPKPKINSLLSDIDLNLVKQALISFKANNLYDAINYNLRAYGPHLLNDYKEISNLQNLVNAVGINGAGPSFFILIENSKIIEFTSYMMESFPEYQLINTSTSKLRCKSQ